MKKYLKKTVLAPLTALLGHPVQNIFLLKFTKKKLRYKKILEFWDPPTNKMNFFYI